MSDRPSDEARAAWHDGDLHSLVAAYRGGNLTPEQIMAAEQQTLASAGKAVGQCASCGSYRLDGRPPLLHQPGCPQKPDLLPTYDL